MSGLLMFPVRQCCRYRQGKSLPLTRIFHDVSCRRGRCLVACELCALIWECQPMSMITVYSEKHFLRNARTELYGGELVPPHECAQRAEFVLERVKATGLGDIIAPSQFGLEPILRVHDADFVDFLRS